jgi:hypothetical protein
LGTLDLRGCTLLDRKLVLHALLEGVKGPIKYSEHLEDDGPHVLEHACEMELEGVVSKRVDGPYQSGRTAYWTKTTCRLRDTFYVAGWAEKNGKFDGHLRAIPSCKQATALRARDLWGKIRLAAQRRDHAICKIEAVNENAHNEVAEGDCQIGALATHALETGAGQREEGGRPIR